jgi:hypothetical protein
LVPQAAARERSAAVKAAVDQGVQAAVAQADDHGWKPAHRDSVHLSRRQLAAG